MMMPTSLKRVLAIVALLALAWVWFWWTLSHTYEQASHNLQGAVGNSVWLSPDGHKEAVFDKDGKPVEDPANKPSYNYWNHKTHPFRHFCADTFPWLMYGNARDDSTTFQERLTAFGKDYVDGIRRSFSRSASREENAK